MGLEDTLSAGEEGNPPLKIMPFQWQVHGSQNDGDEILVWALRENSKPCLLRVGGEKAFIHQIAIGICGQASDGARSRLHETIELCMPPRVTVNRPRWRRITQGTVMDIHGFHPEETFVYHVAFLRESDKRQFLYRFRDRKLAGVRIYNEKIDAVRKFLTSLDLEHSQRIEVRNYLRVDGGISTLDEYFLEYGKAAISIKACPEEFPVCPGILSFDIECYSANHNAFPSADRPRDVVYMVSVVFQRLGHSQQQRSVVVIGEIPPIPETNIFSVRSEVELLEAFAELVKQHDPDIITGYNILMFDFAYLHGRAEMLRYQWPESMTRLRGVGPVIGKRRFKHTGETSTFRALAGRVIFDMQKYMEFFHGKQFPSLKLDYVANYFLDEGKNEMTPMQIFQTYHDHREVHQALGKALIDPRGGREVLQKAGNNLQDVIPYFHGYIHPDVVAEVINRYRTAREGMRTVAEYCVQDAHLVYAMFAKLNVWLTLVEFSNTLAIPMETLFVTGTQIASLNQIYSVGSRRGYAIPSISSKAASYKGAYIMDPTPGVHDNVMCVDFNSMYPSIIRAYNICYSTYIEDRSILPELGSENYHDLEIEEDGTVMRLAFVKPEYRGGVVPQLAENLITERKRVRKRISEIADPTIKVSLDKRQLALKEAANSLYGMMGAAQAMLPMHDAARCITGVGRAFLDQAAKYLVDHHGATIIYGDTDSVMFTCPHITTGLDCMREAPRLAELVSQEFPHPLRMEFEKAGRIFCIVKKKYIYWKLGSDGQLLDRSKPGAYLNQGTAAKRRETPPFIRTLYMSVIDKIIVFAPAAEVMNHILDETARLINGMVPLEELYFVKGVTGTNYTSQTAVMRIYIKYLEECGMKPDVGEMLKIVLVKPQGEGKTLAGHRLRPFESYKAGKIDEPLDYLHYLHMAANQIDKLWSIAYHDVISAIIAEHPQTSKRSTTKFKRLLNQPVDTLQKGLAEKGGNLLACDEYATLRRLFPR